MKSIPVRQITDAIKSAGDAGRFRIRTLQELMNGKDLVQDLHKHNFYFILAVQSGRGIHAIDFIEYKVQAHTVFILRPGQVHRLELKAGATGFLMEFDMAFYQPKNAIGEQRWRKASGKNFCAAKTAEFMKLHGILSGIYDEYSSKMEAYSESVKARLALFFIEFIRQSPFPGTVEKTKSGYIQERFEELIQLLESNICSKKNVSQYASMLSLSAYQLNAIAKSSAGKPVSELITGQVILEAKRYLLATNSQVKDIAAHLGYEDVSYFIRFFKRHTGYSPEAFRKNFK